MLKNADRLVGVHPNLVRVLERGAQIYGQPIMIVQGLRTREQMAVNYGKGRTAEQCVAKGVPAKYAQPKLPKVTWLNDPYASNHGQKADGFGHAVDLSPVPYEPKVTPAYTAIAKAMKQAARELGIAIVWGGDWTKNKDFPHYELA